MKNRNFWIIIGLMVFSLIGIIVMQLIWMTKAISIKEDQFNQLAKQAINRAVYRIERSQNAYLTAEYVSKPSPSMTNQNNSIQNPQIATLHKPRITKTTKDGIETISYGYDTVINNGPASQHIQTYSSVSRPQQTKVLNQNEGSEDIELESSEMAVEFKIREIPMEERLGLTVVGKTLKYELGNNDIPLGFEYAITDYKGQIYNKLSTSGFNIRKAKNIYRTALFPNDIGAESDLLLLYFPEKDAYIYKSLIWQMTGSLAFTLIILFTFFYTLHIILSQKKLSEMKSDFINNMTHEFKTPIATISLASDSILNPITLADTDKILRFTNIIKEENRRMNRQVESVLKMALIDKKDFNLNLVECHVHPIIEKAVQNMALQIEQKRGKITLDLSALNDYIKVDVGHFENVIFNLIDNANKYSLENAPEINLATYNNEGFFCVSVSDKGIGMDKDTQEKVFEKFYRHSTGNVHTVKGFGLGLSYVKAIVLAFKGDVTVKSTKGEGSTFTIKLPIVTGIKI